MNLSPRAFRLEWNIHAWVGVTASLLGFVVFFFGAFAIFVDDMRVWQDPALHAPEREAAPSFDRLLEVASEARPLPPSSSVAFWRHEGTRYVMTFFSDAETGKRETLWIDPESGKTVSERTRLSEELYGMHFFKRVPRGKLLAGLLAMALLIATVSGLLVHLKALPRQWWRFRPEKRLRLSSADAHKVLGVFTLPFALALLWSGAVLCLGAWTDKGLTSAVYGGDAGRVRELSGAVALRRQASGQPADSLAPDQLIARAQAAENSQDAPGFVSLRLIGDANAYARVDLASGRFAGWHRVLLDGVSGEVLASAKKSSTPARTVDETLWDLHFGDYGGSLVDFLYALLALGACAVILTGNIVWLERRDPRRLRLGNRWLERMTVGVAGGAVLGTALSLAANRFLPWELADRAGWEFRSLLWGWGLGVALAFTPRLAPRKVAALLSLASATVFAGVVMRGVVGLDANIVTALGMDLPAVFSVELLLCALALGCGALAWNLLRIPADTTKER